MLKFLLSDLELVPSLCVKALPTILPLLLVPLVPIAAYLEARDCCAKEEAGCGDKEENGPCLLEEV